MKFYRVVFGAGFGSCYARPDTVTTALFESGAKTERGLRAAAHRAARDQFRELHDVDIDDLGYVCEGIREVV